jgi:hypothetical protein
VDVQGQRVFLVQDESSYPSGQRLPIQSQILDGKPFREETIVCIFLSNKSLHNLLNSSSFDSWFPIPYVILSPL